MTTAHEHEVINLVEEEEGEETTPPSFQEMNDDDDEEASKFYVNSDDEENMDLEDGKTDKESCYNGSDGEEEDEEPGGGSESYEEEEEEEEEEMNEEELVNEEEEYDTNDRNYGDNDAPDLLLTGEENKSNEGGGSSLAHESEILSEDEDEDECINNSEEDEDEDSIIRNERNEVKEIEEYIENGRKHKEAISKETVALRKKRRINGEEDDWIERLQNVVHFWDTKKFDEESQEYGVERSRVEGLTPKKDDLVINKRGIPFVTSAFRYTNPDLMTMFVNKEFPMAAKGNEKISRLCGWKCGWPGKALKPKSIKMSGSEAKTLYPDMSAHLAFFYKKSPSGDRVEWQLALRRAPELLREPAWNDFNDKIFSSWHEFVFSFIKKIHRPVFEKELRGIRKYRFTNKPLTNRVFYLPANLLELTLAKEDPRRYKMRTGKITSLSNTTKGNTKKKKTTQKKKTTTKSNTKKKQTQKRKKKSKSKSKSSPRTKTAPKEGHTFRHGAAETEGDFGNLNFDRTREAFNDEIREEEKVLAKKSTKNEITKQNLKQKNKARTPITPVQQKKMPPKRIKTATTNHISHKKGYETPKKASHTKGKEEEEEEEEEEDLWGIDYPTPEKFYSKFDENIDKKLPVHPGVLEDSKPLCDAIENIIEKKAMDAIDGGFVDKDILDLFGPHTVVMTKRAKENKKVVPCVPSDFENDGKSYLVTKSLKNPIRKDTDVFREKELHLRMVAIAASPLLVRHEIKTKALSKLLYTYKDALVSSKRRIQELSDDLDHNTGEMGKMEKRLKTTETTWTKKYNALQTHETKINNKLKVTKEEVETLKKENEDLSERVKDLEENKEEESLLDY